MNSCKILIIDSHSSEMAQRLMTLIKSRSVHDVHIEGWNYISDYSYDIVLPVLISMQSQWVSFLQDLANHHNEAAIVPVISEDHFDPSETLPFLEKGFQDFIVYPYRELEVIARIERFLKNPSLDEVKNVKERLSKKWGLRKLVGKSESFREVVDKIPVVAKSDIDVLLQGDTGTGKELFARAIHYQSPRQSGPFIALNSATLPATLFENEMFGHAKEAFTDARSSRTGIIKEAEGGTLFLDEVDSLEIASQAKLLRFIEERKYKPLGSGKYSKADVRIIAASNVDLRSCINVNKFRKDLFYRLTVITLNLPSLKARREDIPLLAEHFLKKYAHRFGEKKVSPASMKMLCRHTWPGNIRELENVIQQVMIMTPDRVIEPESLPFKAEESQRVFNTFQEAKRKTVEQFEKEYVASILQLHKGNVTQAAKAAGKDRREFGRLVKKHRLALVDEKSTDPDATWIHQNDDLIFDSKKSLP